MPIRILATEVASQIAAGEVVERPASVVKELVENSLDAGAKSVAITIKDAGRSLIEVADDGCGIPADELTLAIARHATSKLATAKDIFSISTLGFRGEALASIGSVSRTTITSRTADAETGARLRVDAGKAEELEQVGGPVGTVVKVEELFYNIPARLKFLKSDTTERRAIDTFVTRYAMAYPDVRFKLTAGKKVTLGTSGDGDRRAILATLYGVDIAKQMLEVDAVDEGMKLFGFISPISVTRSNRREMIFFINGRWVQDISLKAALTQAYHTMLMVARFPLATLFLEIDPEALDVNVHPAKAEIRFRDQNKVFGFVQRSIRKALLAYSPVPSVAPTALWGAVAQQENNRSSPGKSGLDWAMAKQAGNTELELKGKPAPVDESAAPTVFNIPLLRLIGQIGATYLVAEGPDGLYLVDQHAAHERVLFEKFMLQNDKRDIPSQALLQAVSITLPPAQTALLEEHLDLLNRFGFQVEPFGQNTFKIRSMPTLFSGSDASVAIHAIVEDFEEDEAPLQEEIEARIAARVCKRMAVKAGQTLSHEEQYALLIDLENCDSPRTCPHGRPTMIHLSVDMLERQFGRKGAR